MGKIDKCLFAQPPTPPPFQIQLVCVVLIVGFSNFLHSRIFQFKIKQKKFRFLSASIKSPKRIFLHRILFLSMLSLRFWKRNKKVSKIFDCEGNGDKLTYFGRQRTRNQFIKILMAINSKTLRDKNENWKQMWNVGTKRIINRDMKKVQICVMLSRNFSI